MPIPRSTLSHLGDAPIVQYANGLTRARVQSSRFDSLVGFHSEAGRDEAFDRACLDAGIPRVEIKHGSGEIKPHWYFGEQISLFVISAGPVTATFSAALRNGNAARSADAGIGVAWPQGGRSRLAVRGFLAALPDYDAPVQLSVSGKMTDCLWQALVAHLNVAVVADELVNREKHPEEVGFDELALPLRAGEETTWGVESSVTVTPLVCAHPDHPDRAYIRSIWRRDTVAAAVDAQWDRVVSWAHDYAAQGSREPWEQDAA